MAVYSVYDNILIKLESVFLKVETEVDREITILMIEHNILNQQLNDLKSKVDVLNSLKRSFKLYYDKQDELEKLNQSLFITLCDEQILLRFLQEKELLLNGYLVLLPEIKLPTVIEINKEFRLRKRLQEIELLSSFLLEDPRFKPFVSELEEANEIFDLSIESGAIDKLDATVVLFQNFFEKVLHLYNLNPQLIEEFKDFRSEVLLQANKVCPLSPTETDSLQSLQRSYKAVQQARINLELEIDKLLYQFAMLHNGKKIILLEIKNATGELESVIFKEYAIKQKLQELRQYKVNLNNQKDSFMKDPTVDGYAEAVKQLEFVENQFKRLMLHKNFDKQNLVSRFFDANKSKIEKRFIQQENTAYSKILFQVLHNNHISSQDKAIILRLSKPSKLLNTNSGKFFFQRTAKTRSLKSLEDSFKKYYNHELH